MQHSSIQPGTHIALRLASGILKVLEITPNTNINLGKHGSFPANLLLGRPYYLTFEILDKEEGRNRTELRVVPAAELHAEHLASDDGTPAESREEPADGGLEFDIVGEDGEIIMRNNRLTIDDPSRQKLSMEEIEELKKAGTGSGKEIIAKIMASHMALEQKTKFSLAKYTLRKSRKYLRRFTVLPLDVGLLADYVSEKEALKIMELREESLGLIASWANVHCADSSAVHISDPETGAQVGGGRWLVVDDTGGLVVASLAERMGLLHATKETDDEALLKEKGLKEAAPRSHEEVKDSPSKPESANPNAEIKDPGTASGPAQNLEPKDSKPAEPSLSKSLEGPSQSRPRRPRRHDIQAMSSRTNTLTVVHPNNQPNLAFLKYFGFDAGEPQPSHPLFTHLKSLSWLQLLHPEEDPGYTQPEILSDEVLASMKSSKRGNYYKKLRRWEKTKRVVDETRQGGFDGLIVASFMEPETILSELVPLVRGGGRIVVYNNYVEPLVKLCDFYSKERRAAFVSKQFEAQTAQAQNVDFQKEEERTPISTVEGQHLEAKNEDQHAQIRTPESQHVNTKKDGGMDLNTEPEKESTVEEASDRNPPELENDEDSDFPVNPTLLLAPTLFTSRARHWQVLPGRTHPFMTSKGGAEGYLFTATRVIPLEGRVEARGNFRNKKRKTGDKSSVQV